MERRQFPRRNVCIDAEIIDEDFTCKGIVKNISERGIAFETETIDHLLQSNRFVPDKKIQVQFYAPSGELLKLNCKVIWSFKTGPEGMTIRVGMEVIFPPPSYIEFCRTTSHNS